MTISVLLFAAYADLFGRPSLALELEPGATVRDLVAKLRTLPRGGALPPAPMVAVNHRIGAPDQQIEPGDEIAMIPPVAGG